MLETIDRQRDQLIGLHARSERLERELADAREHSELLEFQLLEATEAANHEREQQVP